VKLLALVGLAACSSSSTPPADHLLHTTQTKERTTIVGDHVDLATLPFTDWIDVPAHGTANIKIDVATPGGDLRGANGTIDIACVGVCGIGGTTVHVGKGAFAGDLQIPSIDFDGLDVAAAIDDGHATITRWKMAGKDVEIVASGKLVLAQRLADSTIDACLRFRGMPGLRDREPKLDALLATTGAPAATDGFFNIRLTDRLSSMRRLGSVCDGSAPPPTAPPLVGSGASR
jgi:type II secretion system protein N